MIIRRIWRSLRYRFDIYKYRSKKRNDSLINNYFKNHGVAKLQIGCGDNKLSGWLNTDISIKRCKEGAVYLDAGEPFPLRDACIDYIFSEHLFEHLKYSQALNMLSECHRVLKPHGIIRIATPNLLFLLDLYQNPEKHINKQYIEWSSNGGGGGGEIIPSSSVYVINKFHTYWGHKIVYDPDTLTELLKQNGFCDICQYEIGDSKHDALKNVEIHHKIIPHDFCALETMIFEASKKWISL